MAKRAEGEDFHLLGAKDFHRLRVFCFPLTLYRFSLDISPLNNSSGLAGNRQREVGMKVNIGMKRMNSFLSLPLFPVVIS